MSESNGLHEPRQNPDNLLAKEAMVSGRLEQDKQMRENERIKIEEEQREASHKLLLILGSVVVTILSLAALILGKYLYTPEIGAGTGTMSTPIALLITFGSFGFIAGLISLVYTFFYRR